MLKKHCLETKAENETMFDPQAKEVIILDLSNFYILYFLMIIINEQ